MKKIGIDARLYTKTGVGVYIRNLLHYLQINPPTDITFYIYLMNDEYESISFSSDRFIKRRANFQWHSISEQVGFLSVLEQDRLDLMHFTYFSFPIRYSGKFIATVHDTILFDHKTGKASTRHPFFYELKHQVFKYVFRKQLQNAEKLITPTESVKQSIIRLFGEHYGSKIVAIPEGVSYEMVQIAERKPAGIESFGDYFMYIGNFYPHKNVDRLIEAFAQIDSKQHLLLIGPDDFFAQRIRRQIIDLGQSERILLLSNLSNEEVSYCYKHARALVHPSLAEGFGLPLIEAAYYNLPIIASNSAVYREILGDKYVSFDPLDVSDIEKKLTGFIHSPTSYTYDDVMKRFSFESMTRAILSIYQETA